MLGTISSRKALHGQWCRGTSQAVDEALQRGDRGRAEEQREEGFLQRCREVVAFLRCCDGPDELSERGDLHTPGLGRGKRGRKHRRPGRHARLQRRARVQAKTGERGLRC